MSNLNSLFRKRIGVSEDEELSFESLTYILEKTGQTIPFENLNVIATTSKNDILRENLVDKILIKNEGGLCYELNTIMYLFLKDNGFDVELIRGVVFNQDLNSWGTIGRTHVTVLLTHENKRYLVDTGFGGNLPLRPVPLDGELVVSSNGEFRVKKETTEYGDYILEVKLRHKDKDWRNGYAFNSQLIVDDFAELNEIQDTICTNPDSVFNKSNLISLLTSNGSLTLTDTSFTKWVDGKVEKQEIDGPQFKTLAKQYFGIYNY